MAVLGVVLSAIIVLMVTQMRRPVGPEDHSRPRRQGTIIAVYVGYLRRKIEAEGDAPPLQSIRGVGYVLKAGTTQV